MQRKEPKLLRPGLQVDGAGVLADRGAAEAEMAEEHVEEHVEAAGAPAGPAAPPHADAAPGEPVAPPADAPGLAAAPPADAPPAEPAVALVVGVDLD